jgi:hypothetical protein
VIYTYEVYNDIITLSREMEDGINGIAMTNNGLILLAGNDRVYAWDPATDQLGTILNTGAQTIVYEYLLGYLILGSLLEIDVYSFPEMVNQKTLLFSDTILDMHLQYSK